MRIKRISFDIDESSRLRYPSINFFIRVVGRISFLMDANESWYRIKYHVRSLQPYYWHEFERLQIARYILIVDKFTSCNVATVVDSKLYITMHRYLGNRCNLIKCLIFSLQLRRTIAEHFPIIRSLPPLVLIGIAFPAKF